MADSAVISVQAHRRWPLACLIFVCALWLSLAAARITHGSLASGLPGIVAALAPLLPPIAALLFALSLMPKASRMLEVGSITDRIAEAAKAAAGLEASVAAGEQRIAAMAAQAGRLAQDGIASARGLDEAARALDAAAALALRGGEVLGGSARDLLAVTPQFTAQSKIIESALRDMMSGSADQLRAAEAVLATMGLRLAAAGSAGDAAIAGMVGMLGKIDDASAQTTAAIAKRAYALDAAVDGATARSTALLEALGQSVEARAAAVDASIAGSAERLEELGGEGARAVGQRLDTLLAAATQLGRRFAEHETLATATATTIEQQLAAVEARFAQVHDAGTEMGQSLRRAAEQQAGFLVRTLVDLQGQSGEILGELGARVAAVHGLLDDLGTPVTATQDALTGLDQHTRSVGDSVGALETRLVGTLDGTSGGLDDLQVRASALLGEIESLGPAVDAGAAALARAAAGVAVERGHAMALTDDLAARLEDARQALADVAGAGGKAATEVAAQLAGSFEQLRTAADDSAGQMRTALAAVVAEAEAALDRAGARTSEAAFGAPIRTQIAALDEAATRAADSAQNAAERTSRQLLALVETVAGIERKIDEAEVRFDVRGRDTLTARSARLIDQLNAAAIDVAPLIGAEVDEARWQAYLGGDRSVFARAVVKVFDRDGSRRIARLYKYDEAFRDEASRYVDRFEMLIRRVVNDPDGDDFAATLLTSDVGKLYVAVAQAVGRDVPARAQSGG